MALVGAAPVWAVVTIIGSRWGLGFFTYGGQVLSALFGVIGFVIIFVALNKYRK